MLAQRKIFAPELAGFVAKGLLCEVLWYYFPEP
jgi:hypothetical protein